MSSFEVPLSFTDMSKLCGCTQAPSLTYSVKPYTPSNGARIQPILNGRRLLEPTIDLNQYRCKAVLDWIEIQFQTPGKHQAVNIHRFANSVLSEYGSASTVFVFGPSHKKGYQGSEFILRIQQPQPRDFRLLCDRLIKNYNLGLSSIGDLNVAGVEISVDFFVKPHPELSSDDQNRLRWQMTDLLRRHLKPHPVLTEEERCHPRFFSDENGQRHAKFFVKTRKQKLSSKAYAEIMRLGVQPTDIASLRLDAHHQPPVDRTSYIGENGYCVQLRVMDKITDKRDPETNRCIELPPKERRSRVEVTLQARNGEVGGAAAVGLHTLDDLFSYNFQKVRKPFFEFFLPTFNPGDETSGVPFPVTITEGEVFARSGVYGLDRVHRSVETIKSAQYRNKAISEKPQKLGSKGKMVSYCELNQKVDRALRQLSKDWTSS